MVKDKNLVPRAGLEPATLSLEVSCSIQLSYRGRSGAGWGSRNPVSSLENLHINRYTNPARAAQ